MGSYRRNSAFPYIGKLACSSNENRPGVGKFPYCAALEEVSLPFAVIGTAVPGWTTNLTVQLILRLFFLFFNSVLF